MGCFQILVHTIDRSKGNVQGIIAHGPEGSPVIKADFTMPIVDYEKLLLSGALHSPSPLDGNYKARTEVLLAWSVLREAASEMALSFKEIEEWVTDIDKKGLE